MFFGVWRVMAPNNTGKRVSRGKSTIFETSGDRWRPTHSVQGAGSFFSNQTFAHLTLDWYKFPLRKQWQEGHSPTGWFVSITRKLSVDIHRLP